MDTVTQPAVTDPEPDPDRDAIYRIYRERVEEAAARRGLPPEPWPA